MTPATREYTIETLGDDGRWFIVGSERLSGDAQHHMHRYQRDRPGTAFRVVENPSRVLVLCVDQRPEARCWVRQNDGSFIRPGTEHDAVTLHHPDDDSEHGIVLASTAAEALRVDRETFGWVGGVMGITFALPPGASEPREPYEAPAVDQTGNPEQDLRKAVASVATDLLALSEWMLRRLGPDAPVFGPDTLSKAERAATALNTATAIYRARRQA